MPDFRGEVIISESIARGRRIINPLSTSEDDKVDFTNDYNFYIAHNSSINIARVGLMKGRQIVTLKSLSHK